MYIYKPNSVQKYVLKTQNIYYANYYYDLFICLVLRIRNWIYIIIKIDRCNIYLSIILITILMIITCISILSNSKHCRISSKTAFYIYWVLLTSNDVIVHYGILTLSEKEHPMKLQRKDQLEKTFIAWCSTGILLSHF